MIAVIIVLVVVVVAAAVVTFVSVKRRRFARNHPAEHALRLVTKQHESAVGQAQSALKSAEKGHAREVRAAERALDAAQLVGRSRLGAYRGKDGMVVLYEDRLSYNGRDVALTPDVTATVDTAGNVYTKSRSTFTRMGAGAMLLGPVGLVAGAAARKSKVNDARELYLMVQSSTFAVVVSCNPNDGPTVRQIAAAIMNAARNVHTAAPRHAAAVAQAAAALKAAKARTGEIEAARRELETRRSDTAAVDAARAAVDVTPDEPA